MNQNCKFIPYSGSIDITNTCNLKCLHCFHQSNELKNVVPVKEKYYIRKENDTYRIIPPLGYGFMKILNRSSKQILDYIDGNRSLKEILQSLYKKYGNVKKETIKEDFIKKS